MVSGFCMACPENTDTAMADLREIGPSFFFAPPRTFEQLLTRLTDPHGGCELRQAQAVPLLHRRGAALRRTDPQQAAGAFAGRLLYWLGNVLVYAPLKNVLGLSNVRIAYTAGEAIGPDLFSFYRSLGLNLETALRPDRSVPLSDGAARRTDLLGHRRAGAAQCRPAHSPRTARCCSSRPACSSATSRTRPRPAETMTPDGFVKTGDAGFFDSKTGHLKIIDRAKDVGKLKDGTLFPPKYIENKLKFFPNIREAVAYGDGRDFVAVMLNIDLTAVGSWAERNNVVYGSYQELAGHPLVYDMLRRTSRR
jgi:long-chain acyl-CoA synthetase